MSKESKKIVVITGTTSGIGKATAVEILKEGHTVIAPIRNPEKATVLQNETKQYPGKLEVLSCELTSMKSVRKAADEITKNHEKIDILINNAGGGIDKKTTTEEGIDASFAMNHLGHFLLTNLLLKSLQNAKTSKVINVSSELHRFGNMDWENVQFEKSYSGISAYNTNKFYNVLFTKAIARKFSKEGIHSYSLHPGVVRTNISSGLNPFFQVMSKIGSIFMISPEDGAKTTLYLFRESENNLENGGYYNEQKLAKNSSAADDQKLQDQFWDYSLERVKKFLT